MKVFPFLLVFTSTRRYRPVADVTMISVAFALPKVMDALYPFLRNSAQTRISPAIPMLFLSIFRFKHSGILSCQVGITPHLRALLPGEISPALHLLPPDRLIQLIRFSTSPFAYSIARSVCPRRFISSSRWAIISSLLSRMCTPGNGGNRNCGNS